MASSEEIRDVRIAKIKLLKEKGINPYPIKTERTYTIENILNNFDALGSAKTEVSICGRVMAFRKHGALIFTDLNDGTGVSQCLLKQDELGESEFGLFEQTIDIGDFVSVSGTLFLTKRNEKTVAVKLWQILAKSLNQLPEKWHGLQDVEERFRRRYLDTLMSQEVKNRFLKRAKIISSLRKRLDNAGYVEVETPMLQSHAGGATALPFKTHHNALDIDLFLRIAPELYLKKLLIGGFEKIYEIGRNFRNEGIDVTHNPEFTMLEYYESYSDSEKQMRFTGELLTGLCEDVLGTKKFPFGDKEIDLGRPFEKITFFELLEKLAGLKNPEQASEDEILARANELGIKIPPAEPREKIMDAIYKKVCRPKLIQPTFITDYPTDYLPLAKRIEGKEGIVDAFQLIVGGLEIVKAFSELNDPFDQIERFKKQEENRSAGDLEAQTTDKEFIEALEYGMPPAGGVGIGIDRLVMLFTDTKNIREVILFPTLRPK